MCEVGALLCQNFQPSWDPVIAEFKLLTESRISMFEKHKIKIIVTLEKENPPFWVYLASASGRLLWVQHWLCLEIPAPQIHPSDLQFFHHWSDNCLEQALWPVKTHQHTQQGLLWVIKFRHLQNAATFIEAVVILFHFHQWKPRISKYST